MFSVPLPNKLTINIIFVIIIIYNSALYNIKITLSGLQHIHSQIKVFTIKYEKPCCSIQEQKDWQEGWACECLVFFLGQICCSKKTNPQTIMVFFLFTKESEIQRNNWYLTNTSTSGRKEKISKRHTLHRNKYEIRRRKSSYWMP